MSTQTKILLFICVLPIGWITYEMTYYALKPVEKTTVHHVSSDHILTRAIPFLMREARVDRVTFKLTENPNDMFVWFMDRETGTVTLILAKDGIVTPAAP